MIHHLYLSPGFFGFGRLASYDYFTHVERALASRLSDGGHQVVTHVTHVSPTASIRRRAIALAQVVSESCDVDGTSGPIHFVGHSTGGLDARLVASPSAALGMPAEKLAWRGRLASVTTINAPHFGTPLATFFTTASGQRALRLLTVLTVVALSFGSPPLAIARALVAAFGGVDRSLGLKIKTFDEATQLLLRLLDDVRGADLHEYVAEISKDQGAMVQLMPEAMDLYIAGVEDSPDILYQCTASMTRPPALKTFLPFVVHPWGVISGTVFSMLYAITADCDRRYPCAAPSAGPENEALLAKALGTKPGIRENDGVVPIRSQIWGKLVWAGYGDHLDVLGHFYDVEPKAKGSPLPLEAGPPHLDWLYSGSDFGRPRFESLMDAIAAGMLASTS
jgi:triacylglycerol lipase